MHQCVKRKFGLHFELLTSLGRKTLNSDFVKLRKLIEIWMTCESPCINFSPILHRVDRLVDGINSNLIPQMGLFLLRKRSGVLLSVYHIFSIPRELFSLWFMHLIHFCFLSFVFWEWPGFKCDFSLSSAVRVEERHTRNKNHTNEFVLGYAPK
jgi:hypothetical protein